MSDMRARLTAGVPPAMPEWQLRRELTRIARALYQRGFVSASDGNLSVRAGRERLLVTPAGSCLGELRPQDLLYVAGDGGVLAGRAQPTSELPMHLAVYSERPDVQAVIHAHPVMATALSVAGIRLETPILPELVLHLGGVPTAPYATLATAEGADAVRELVREHDALILDRHGTLTIGTDLAQAFRNLERVEHSAQILLRAHLLGQLRPLSTEEVARLERLRSQRVPLTSRAGSGLALR